MSKKWREEKIQNPYPKSKTSVYRRPCVHPSAIVRRRHYQIIMTMVLLPSYFNRILSAAPAPSRLHSICRRKVTTNARLRLPSAAATATAKQPTTFLFFPPRCCYQNHSSAVRSIHTTPITYAQITINVPTMGDSITEGTIVEWCVPPGSRVREGDVLALVETDKVTVDIKADRDGVLVKQLGEVEGVVEVGQGLYILDTDVTTAGSSVGAPESKMMGNVVDVSAVNASLDAEKMVAETPSLPTSSSLPSPSTSMSLSSGGGRIPSIHFLGKEGWKERRSGTSTSTYTDTTQTTKIISTLDNNPQHPSRTFPTLPCMEDHLLWTMKWRHLFWEEPRRLPR